MDISTLNIWKGTQFHVQRNAYTIFYLSGLTEIKKGFNIVLVKERDIHIYCWWECKLIQSLWRAIWQYLLALYVLTRKDIHYILLVNEKARCRTQRTLLPFECVWGQKNRYTCMILLLRKALERYIRNL